MIVDVHYHFFLYPDIENSARTFSQGQSRLHSRLGVDKPSEEVMDMYLDYFDDADGDKLIQRMDEAGIDISVLVNMDIPRTTDDSALLHQHDECARVVARHPERLVALAGVDPRRPGAPSLLRHCIEEFDMKGLKWHPDMGFYPNSEESYEVLNVLNEFELPLLTHCAPLTSTRAKYALPIHLDDIAIDFPNISVIAAHSGYLWWHDWVALAQLKPNISGDLAAWQAIAESKPNLFRRYLREILDIIGHEQLLFGTDGPFCEAFVSNKVWVDMIKDMTIENSDGIVFSQEEVNAILGGNAARIFNL